MPEYLDLMCHGGQLPHHALMQHPSSGGACWWRSAHPPQACIHSGQRQSARHKDEDAANDDDTVVHGSGGAFSVDEDAANDNDPRSECKESDVTATVAEEAGVVNGGGLIENGEGPCDVGAVALRA